MCEGILSTVSYNGVEAAVFVGSHRYGADQSTQPSPAFVEQ
jgi:hypothetical protein